MYKFSPMTDRVSRVREKYRSTVPYVDTTRYRIVTDFYMQNQELSGILKRAMNFRNLCEKLPVIIREDDMVVGSYVTTYRASAIYPENSIDFLIDEIKSGELSTRESDPYLMTEEDKKIVLDTADFWLHECMNAKLNPYIPEKFSDIVDGSPMFFPPKNVCPQPVGHFITNYDRAIRVGFGKIKAEAEEKMRQLEEDGFMGADAEKYSFYRSVSIVCEGIITLAKRYSAEAAHMAENCSDPIRKKELERIADTMGWIMENPARDFRDAVQALWFYEMCVMMDANMHGASIGRVDQYLGSYAEADLAAGRITREEAQELIDLYYLNIAAMNKVWGARNSKSSPGYTSGQLITLGGRNSEGKDASNVVTYMCLEAVGRMKLHSPSQALRVHKDTPKEIWDLALSVNKIAGGVPAFFSDESCEAALLTRGISKDEVWNYSLVGCVEPSLGGAEWPACGGLGIGTYFNLVNVFLLAINNGKNFLVRPDGSRNDKQIGPQTGYLYEMTSIEQVKEAYLTQQKYWVKWHVNIINMFESIAKDVLAQPLVSATMDGCMEKGRDVMKGGAKYNSTGHSAIGLGNVVDCFNAVEHLCFKEKICTTRELYDALINNWKGYEELQNYILNEMPHYGNGIPEYDKYCSWVSDVYAECVKSMSGPRGNHYAPGNYPVTMNVVYGRISGASPDGRNAGAPLSDGISAVQGMDKNGPTAILRSVSSFDQTKYSNGTLLNMKFHPTVLANEDGFEKLRQLMQTYFIGLGGMEMQINVVSSETLRDAQAHPENYKDLVVRIAGFSAYFVEVYKDAQDDLIRRTELGM